MRNPRPLCIRGGAVGRNCCLTSDLITSAPPPRLSTLILCWAGSPPSAGGQAEGGGDSPSLKGQRPPRGQREPRRRSNGWSLPAPPHPSKRAASSSTWPRRYLAGEVGTDEEDGKEGGVGGEVKEGRGWRGGEGGKGMRLLKLPDLNSSSFRQVNVTDLLAPGPHYRSECGCPVCSH